MERVTLNSKVNKGIQREYLSIEVTTFCDGSCNYCFSLPGKENQHLSMHTAHDIIIEGRSLAYEYLHLTGGEPFLWPNLSDFLQMAVDIGYKRILINTGGRVNQDLIKSLALKYVGKLRFTVTLNGPEEFHEKTRGPGNYFQVLSTINFLDKQNIHYEIFTVVTKQLLSNLPKFSQWVAEKYGNIAWHTWIQLHRVPDDIHDVSDKLLSPEDFITLVKYAGTLIKFGLRIRILDNPLAQVVAHRLGSGIASSNSLIRPGRISILVDETITSAHSLRNTFLHYQKGALSKLLGSEQYKQSYSQNENRCSDCDFNFCCRENGMFQPSEDTRDNDLSAPFCVRVNLFLNEHP